LPNTANLFFAENSNIPRRFRNTAKVFISMIRPFRPAGPYRNGLI
jgi:hypothetical protein